MANIKSTDYYERLDIQENASQDTIKSGFFALVREYPPQRNPDDYKLIREAYDILKNPKTREDYDSRRKFGPEIENLNEQLDQANESSDWNKSEVILKKLINLQPKNSLLRLNLGRVYMSLDSYDKAINAFEAAMKLDPAESSFVVALATAYRQQEDYAEAEKYYRMAMQIDESNVDAVTGLAFMYWYKVDREQDAIAELERAIDKDGVLDFQDFIYILDLLRMHMLGGHVAQMKKRLNQMNTIIVNNGDKTMVVNSILGLTELGIYKQYLKESAVLFDFIAKLENNEAWSANARLLYRSEDLSEDKGLDEVVRFMAFYLTINYFDQATEKNKEFLDKFADLVVKQLENPFLNKQVKDSVLVIKSKYSEIFSINTEYWTLVLDANAKDYGSSCPHCKGNVMVPLGSYSAYNCPHCKKGFLYGPAGYSIPSHVGSASTTTSQSSGGGCLISLMSILLLLIGILIMI